MCIFKLNTTPTNSRLAAMGLIEGITFRIVKKVNGMVQLRIGGNDIVIQEELLLKEIDYGKHSN
jgi:Fe2+ transport system protein FeoA